MVVEVVAVAGKLVLVKGSGAGGPGGGGAGGTGTNNSGSNACTNTGGGGGGGAGDCGVSNTVSGGGNGGSGRVVVKELRKASGVWNLHDHLLSNSKNSTWVTRNVSIDYLVVAGGGGAGCNRAGGGGAGGYRASGYGPTPPTRFSFSFNFRMLYNYS